MFSGNFIFMSLGLCFRNLISSELDNFNVLLYCLVPLYVLFQFVYPIMIYPTMVQIFFYLLFSLIFLFQLNQSLIYFLKFFLFSAIVFSWILSSVESMTKFLLGITLFSLLYFVYAIIGIGTIGITVNTHQVLTIKAQTAKLLRQHRPSRVPSCLTDWIPYAMASPVRG